MKHLNAGCWKLWALWVSIALHAVVLALPSAFSDQKNAQVAPVAIVQLTPRSRVSTPFKAASGGAGQRHLSPKSLSSGTPLSEVNETARSQSASRSEKISDRPHLPAQSSNSERLFAAAQSKDGTVAVQSGKQARTEQSIASPTPALIPQVPAPVPSTTPAAEPPALALELAQSEFQGFITAIKTGDNFTTFSLLELLELFGQPGQIELFFNPQGEQKPGILEFHVFPDKTPQQVVQGVVLAELGDRQGFELEIQPGFTTSQVFTATKNGFTRHLQLVALNARSGSVLVVWDRLPTLVPH